MRKKIGIFGIYIDFFPMNVKVIIVDMNTIISLVVVLKNVSFFPNYFAEIVQLQLNTD